MKLIPYEKINSGILQKFHKQDVFINGLDNMFLLQDVIEIFEYKNNVDIYFDRCFPLLRNTYDYIKFVEEKFKKSTNVYISIKNPCLQKIIKKLELEGYNCPRTVSKSLNNVEFKTPKIILTRGYCKNKLRKPNLKNSEITFDISDVNFFKSLLNEKFESGGVIEKHNGKYKIVKSSVTKGKKDNIDLDISPYNFHTHPYSVYGDNFSGWFSGDDVKYIIFNSFLGLKEHFLITVEGIYRLGVSKKFLSTKFKKNQLDDIVNYIFEMFLQLEDMRQVDNFKTTDVSHKKTVRVFNDFFVIINSIHSSWFKLKGDFRIFNLDFKKWEHFK